MTSPDRRFELQVVLEDPPLCPICSATPPVNLGFRDILDGASTILTDFVWICRCGHQWPAGWMDMPVPADQVPTFLRLAIGKVYGENGPDQ
jgi:hypothetical protein